MIDKSNIENIYALTPMQEGMLYHSLDNPEDTSYFEQISYRLEGSFDEYYFKEGLKLLFERHDILRTIFVHENTPQPLQIVLKNRNVKIVIHDLKDREAAFQDSLLEKFKREDRYRSFALHRDILLRCAIFRVSDNEVEIIWSFHHIILDGWSFAILLEELSEIYNSLRSDKMPTLSRAPRFVDFIKWLDNRDLRVSKDYWKNYLENIESLTYISDLSDQDKPYQLEELHLRFSTEKFLSVQKLAQDCEITLNTVLQTLWSILLANYNRTTESIFGIPVSGRPVELHEVEKSVGLFINTIPVRVGWEENTRVKELMQKVQLDQTNCQSHQFLSLADIQAGSSIKQSLFDHLLVFENYPLSKKLENGISEGMSGFKITKIESFEHTHYPFMLTAEATDTFHFRYSYDVNRVSSEMAGRIAGHFNQILESWIVSPEVKVNELNWVTPVEEELLIDDWNNIKYEYPADLNMISVFEDAAIKHPDRVALITEDRKWTYGEVLTRVNQVANYLRIEVKTKRQDFIALQIERSPEMIFGIFGVLKAGCIYVPISTTIPEKRLDMILGDCNAKIVLNNDIIEKTENYRSDSSLAYVDKEDLAYLIYTSGSTGQPKGVMVRHESILNRLLWMNRVYPPAGHAVFILKTAYTFDVSIWELFAWTFSDASLYILPPGKEKVPEYIMFSIDRHSVTHIHFVPSMLSVFLEDLHQFDFHDKIGSLIHVNSSGEAITPEQIRRFYTNFSRDVLLLNVYGPTEASIEVSHFDCRETLKTGQVFIGKPIDNLRLYILNGRSKSLMPIGVKGEIAIGGKGVAEGYLGKQELTAERFHQDPFHPDERIYLTGDLGRWHLDGNIEYLGRIDSQIKIRGFRVEPGEIELTLEAHPSIQQAIVKAINQDSGCPELIAYIRASSTLSTGSLREYLSNSLPEYMIPSYFRQLDVFPLSSSGKVNKNELPLPNKFNVNDENIENLQEGPTKELAELWTKILGVKEIKRHSDFFELGGHSLKAMRLASLIKKSLKQAFSVTDTFKYPVFQEMFDYLQGNIIEDVGKIPIAPFMVDYPLSPSQKQMWIQHQMEASPSVYNVAAAWSVNGDLNIDHFTKSISLLIRRHEILRTTFHETNGMPIQRVEMPFEFQIESHEKNIKNLDEAIEKINDWSVNPFDLTQLPLFKMMLLSKPDNSKVIALCIHHIISDEWSFRRMVKEIFESYNELQKGQIPRLSPLRIQYKDYAVYMDRRLKEGKMKENIQYWKDILKPPLPVLLLPTDFKRSEVINYEGQTHRFEINNGHWKTVNDITKDNEGTLFITLQCLTTLLLADISDSHDIIMGMPVAGRDQPELENQLGYYLNTVVLRNKFLDTELFGEMYQRIKTDSIQALKHQNYSFEALVRALNIERSKNRQPIFDILFVFQNYETIESISPDGLEFNNFDFKMDGSKFDLTFGYVEGPDRIYVNLEYNTSLFQETTIQMFATLLQDIIERYELTPDGKAGEIGRRNYLSEAKLENAPSIEFDFD